MAAIGHRFPDVFVRTGGSRPPLWPTRRAPDTIPLCACTGLANAPREPGAHADFAKSDQMRGAIRPGCAILVALGPGADKPTGRSRA